MKNLLLFAMAFAFYACGSHTFDNLGANGNCKGEKCDDNGEENGDKGKEVVSQCAGKSAGSYVFRSVTIGSQTWMAENVNCDAEGSKCFDDKPVNCEKYGRMYDWETAKDICSGGWHLPTKEEWETLINYVETANNCSDCSGIHLKARSDWDTYVNEGYFGVSYKGIDTYGFNALPVGMYGTDFYNWFSTWWSATEYNASDAYDITMSYDNQNSDLDKHTKRRLQSVRCVRD